jgi:transposase InsO family protein
MVCSARHPSAVHPARKPDQNAFIERFNKTYRDEVLDACVFDAIEQVREITESWLREYNEERPQDALGRVPYAGLEPGDYAWAQFDCQ